MSVKGMGHAAVTVLDTSSIDLTLTGQQVSGVVLPAGVDHGGLAGLADDDHPQYMTPAEHTAVGDGSPHHAAITLAADADVVMGLTGQQITLDSQNANIVLAGPATAPAADPTFRALVAADIPLLTITDDKLLNFAYTTNVFSTFGTAWGGAVMRDAQTDGCRVTWHVPTGFVALTSVEVIGLPDATGNMIWDVYTNAGADGEAWNNQAANVNTQTKAVTINNQFRVAATSAFPATIAAGDAVGILFQRQGGHASDTVGNIVTIIGIRIKYTRTVP